MNKQLLVLSLLVLLSFSIKVTQHKKKQFIHLEEEQPNSVHFCPDQLYRDQDEFDAFIEELDDAFSGDKIDVLQNYLGQNAMVFSPDQVYQVLETVGYIEVKMLALEAMDNFIPYLETQQVIDIMDSVSYSNEKLEALERLAPFLLSLDDENKDQILQSLTYDDLIEKGTEILDNIPERNCLFGSVEEEVAVFIIDISGSMKQEFNTDDGPISRLNYVKQQLKNTISTQLQPYQKFNVVEFSTLVTQWKYVPQEATQENIESALRWIDRLIQGGWTNISYSLDFTFRRNKQVDAIYFLSDGVPSKGITDLDQMIEFVQGLEEKRDNQVKINTISFMMGGEEGDDEKELSRQFLSAIAFTSNGGSFKQMTDL